MHQIGIVRGRDGGGGGTDGRCYWDRVILQFVREKKKLHWLYDTEEPGNYIIIFRIE